MRVQVVVGAQYGSEAKGHVTAQLAKDSVDRGHLVVNTRVAGPNAGHSVVDSTGYKWALRSVPVGAALGGGVISMIAPGSEVDPNVLFDEVDSLMDAGLLKSGDIVVDAEATVLEGKHIEQETGMHERIGSTGKGIGAARADRIMRTARRVADDTWLLDQLKKRGIRVANTSRLAQEFYRPRTLVVEGTQGYGLGLHAGHYPQCTSSNCRAIDFLAMAGISPWSRYVTDLQVMAVARVYPIRVAGNSGPLANETTWAELGLPEELTTVTRKVRRVGLWDDELVAAAVRENGGEPTVSLAISMIDQLVPTVEGVTSKSVLLENHKVREFIRNVEQTSNARVRMVTTSDRTAVWL